MKLLTIDNIADLYQCARSRAERIVRDPGFPEPAPGSSPRFRRWREDDVLAFLAGVSQ